jgi:hypothetical protein
MNSNLFEKVKAAFSKISSFRIARALTVVMIGLLVITTTACNPSSPQASNVGSGGTTYNDRAIQNPGLREYTDREDGKSRPDLGSYRDESAQDRLSTKAKAEDLTQRAKQNIKKSDSPEEFAREYRSGTPLGERVKNITDNVGKAVDETVDDVSEGTRKGVRNIKQNTENAGNTVQDAAQDAQRDARRNLDNAADFAQDRATDLNRNRT